MDSSSERPMEPEHTPLDTPNDNPTRNANVLHPDLPTGASQLWWNMPYAAPPPPPKQRQWLHYSAIGAGIILAFLLGMVIAARPGSGQTHTLIHATATLAPTATTTPQPAKILAAWMSIGYSGQCNGCDTFSFSISGPVDILTTCNPFQVFADSDPSFNLLIYDANGHQVDSIQKSCGDPNNDIVATATIPEHIAPGSYTADVYEVTTAPLAVMVIAK